MLALAGVQVNLATEAQEFAGIPFAFGPKVFIEPTVALTFADLKGLFTGSCKIDAPSTIVLGGQAGETPLKDVQINGTIMANKAFNFFDHFRQDERIEFIPSTESDPEVLRIRGFKPNTVFYSM